MSYKIQITVDEALNKTVRESAKKMGLSVSSYARLALLSALPRKKGSVIDRSLNDLDSNRLETLSLNEFSRQIDRL